MKTSNVWLSAAVFLSALVAGCQPKTPAEKVKNSVEDATHETGQAIERAGDRVKDAAN